MPNPFGGLRVRIDPWEIEYGGELPLQDAPGDPVEDVVLDAEVPVGDWRPVTPEAVIAPETIFFVDGIRRAEALLVLSREDRLCHGAVGSFAVGAVAVRNGVASWHTEQVGRLVVVGSGETLPAALHLDPALVYLPVSAAGDDADAPLLVIHREMRSAEETLARELAHDHSGALVVVDGPLTFGGVARGQAVGFVKRLFKMYVPQALLGVLRQMQVGQRSPIFAIKGAGRFARLSWFVRLAQPMPADADLTGLARLEVADVVGLEVARRLADATTTLLPRYVPSRGRDPRAPQNLLPIGALEAHLRRRLGDTRLIRRKLAALITKESAGV